MHLLLAEKSNMDVRVDVAEHPEPAMALRRFERGNRKAVIFKWIGGAAFVVSMFSVLAVASKSGSISQKALRRSATSLDQAAVRTPAGKKDICLEEFSRHGRAECLQPLLEAYYEHGNGGAVTSHCPNLGLLFAGEKCRNCPWDTVAPSSIRKNTTFHAAGKECRVADHVQIYTDKEELFKTYYRASIAVSLIIAALSVLGISSGKQVIVLGHSVHEAVYLGFFWFAFNWCAIVWARTQDFRIYCESLSAIFTDQAARYIAYATVLYVSISRCLHLPSRILQTGTTSSWASFVSEVFVHWSFKPGRERVLASVVSLLTTFVVIVFIVPLFFQYDVGSNEAASLCLAGYRDYVMGAIQVSKLVLQSLSVVVYALGPQRSQCGRIARFAALAIIMVLSFGVLCLTFTDMYKPLGVSALFSRARDSQIAFDFTEAIHAIVVALFGLLEPFRVKSPVSSEGIAGRDRNDAAIDYGQ